MVWTGLNDVIGSWNTSEMSPPRISRISLLSAWRPVRSTSVPSSRRSTIVPPTIRPGRSTIRRMDRAVTLLPQPLSPTIPRARPAWTSKVAPSTASTTPSS